MKHLSPSQESVYVAVDRLIREMPGGRVVILAGEGGSGKSTLLRNLHRSHGGALLGASDFMAGMHDRHPLALEERVDEMVRRALQEHDLVLVDDMHRISGVLCSSHFSPRNGFLDVAMEGLCREAEEAGKCLVLAGGSTESLSSRGFSFQIPDFQPEDYGFFCSVFLEGAEASLDMAKIHRFAPNLDAWQLRGACRWLRLEGGPIATPRFIDYLRSRRMSTNVDLEEVQQVDLRDLKGVDDVIEALEANVVLPLENDALAEELSLRPRRGVLLVGPPGTGKTTVGRALAHRLKGKFLLVDGTIVSGTSDFYGQIFRIFKVARENAPSVIFIDDTDAIFESGEELGLYRYLLTMLDGLESEGHSRVCVLMTAMDVANLPPALVRSGRIELWLDMKLPDDAARREIFAARLAALPPALRDADPDRLVEMSQGFTGADVKRLVEDGKTLYAYDRSRGTDSKPALHYFTTAADSLKANRARYEEAASQARAQRPSRLPIFNVMRAMAEE